jgi:hypothetical protein
MIDFDHYCFRCLDLVRVYSKIILTRLNLRDKQSCKHCGRTDYGCDFLKNIIIKACVWSASLN